MQEPESLRKKLAEDEARLHRLMEGEEPAGDEEQEQDEEQPTSRITIEFGGLGQADVTRAEFENISLGQMMVFVRYAEWQCQNAIRQYEADRRAEAERRAKLQGIVVPGMGLVQ